MAVIFALAFIYAIVMAVGYVLLAVGYMLLAVAPILMAGLAAWATLACLDPDNHRRYWWMALVALVGCSAAGVAIYWATTGEAWYAAAVAGGLLAGIVGAAIGYAISRAIWPRAAPTADAANIAPGDSVRHRRWGDGIVHEVRGTGDSAEALVTFGDYGTKRLQLVLRTLEKI